MDANDYRQRGGNVDFNPANLTVVQVGVIPNATSATSTASATSTPPTPITPPVEPPSSSPPPTKKAVITHRERRLRKAAAREALRPSTPKRGGRTPLSSAARAGIEEWAREVEARKAAREVEREARRARAANTQRPLERASSTTTNTTTSAPPHNTQRPLEDASSTNASSTNAPPPPNTQRPLEDASPPPPPSPSPPTNVAHYRAPIRIEPGRSDIALARVECVLGMSGKVFERGGKLVSLGSFRGRLPQAYRAATAGIPQARAALCTSSSIACVLARHADIEIWNTIKSNYGPGLVPEHITAALLDWPSYESIPHLAGVVEVPTIDHEGRVIDTPGFDEATCLWYAPRDHNDHAAEPLTVGTTHADAKAACATLLDFVGQFPFVADHDRAAWLSYALTIAGRPAIQGPVPAFTFAAPSKRTGKTFLTEIGSIIGTGHSAADARLSDSSDEGGKHLTALMLQAARVVRFDNLKKGRAFEYPPIESTLTTGVWSGRLLGKSIVITGEWHAVIVATGVDLTVGLEMSGRCIPCVLDSGMEHPEDRVGFLESNIVAAALRDQRKLLSAALTILRAHALAGRPTPIAATKNPWGDYAAWQSVVRDAVLWAYGHDPIGGRVALRERVNESDGETALLKAFAAFQTVRGGSAGDGGPAWWAVAEVHTACSYSKDVPPRDEYRELRAALSIATRFKGDGAPSRQSIAGVLSSLIKAPRAGLVLCRDRPDNERKLGAQYRVEKTRVGDFVPDPPENVASTG